MQTRIQDCCRQHRQTCQKTNHHKLFPTFHCSRLPGVPGWSSYLRSIWLSQLNIINIAQSIIVLYVLSVIVGGVPMNKNLHLKDYNNIQNGNHCICPKYGHPQHRRKIHTRCNNLRYSPNKSLYFKNSQWRACKHASKHLFNKELDEFLVLCG